MTLAEIKPNGDCYIVREHTCRLEDKLWSGLGRRTEWGVVCSNCNAHIAQAVKRRFRFCPNCGAKAVDE